MKKLPAILPLAALFILSACNEVTVATPDGSVPAQYVAQASAVTGDYVGKFNGVKGSLSIRFEGVKPVLAFSGQHGSELIDPKCDSKIGALVGVTVRQKKGKPGELLGAQFAFDPGQCTSIEGRQIELSFSIKPKKPIVLRAQVFADSYTIPGSTTCTGGGDTPVTCSVDPDTTGYDYYSGKFQKN